MNYYIGQRFGKVVVIGEEKYEKNRKYVKVKCDCGKTKYLRTDQLKKAKSCGCLNKNSYGMLSKDYEKLYGVWSNMRKRCYNPKSERYYSYGEKGICICEKWKNDFHSFADWCLENGWNPKLSIERIDVHKNYCPENCTFITMKEQARNKTSNVLITKNGETRCATEWGELLGINPKSIMARIYRGYNDPNVILFQGDLRELRRASSGK